MTDLVENPVEASHVTMDVPTVPVGEQLRAARQGRGLEVADIAQTLKLGQRQVEALENGDWEALPGQTFIRGFVRNYARLVQIDAQPLMAQLDGLLAKPADNLAMHGEQPAAMPSSGAQSAGRDRMLIVVGAVLLGLASTVYFLLPSDLSGMRDHIQSLLDALGRKESATVIAQQPAVQPAADPVFPPGATQQQVMYPQVLTPAESAPQVANSTSADAPQPSAGGAVANAPQLRFLLEKDSWVEVRDRDNRVVFSQKLVAGTEQSISGQGPLSLTVGYAPGVKLFWRGQVIDLVPHTKADVARLVLE